MTKPETSQIVGVTDRLEADEASAVLLHYRNLRDDLFDLSLAFVSRVSTSRWLADVR
jgi:hypothetical protein